MTVLSGQEEEALAGLLAEVLPSFGNDEDAKIKAITSIADAWTHKPTRKLTQDLWKQVFSSNSEDGIKFAALVQELQGSLVPEAMGVAVTIAQRIAAITAMQKLIESEGKETDLQRLIEKFPWLLGPGWEKLTANQEIRTLVEKKQKPDTDMGEWQLPAAAGSLKPDFVFLSDVSAQHEIIVFELKGPECGKTLQPEEYSQLRHYLDIIERVYTSKDIKISGFLVGHEKGGFNENDKRITVDTWWPVLTRARALHVSYLAALLEASHPVADDTRMQQIADFGGKATMELVEKLRAMATYPKEVNDGLARASA